MRARATATMASASRAKAVRMAIRITDGRRRYSSQKRTGASVYRATPATAMTVSGPRLASSGRGRSSGGSPNSDTTAQATISASTPRPEQGLAAQDGLGPLPGQVEARRGRRTPPPAAGPTGVAMANPALRPMSSTCGSGRGRAAAGTRRWTGTPARPGTGGRRPGGATPRSCAAEGHVAPRPRPPPARSGCRGARG